MSFVGIKPGARKRARLVDARMGWLSGTTLGKMAMIWEESQSLRLEIATKAEILIWAEMAEHPDAEKWVANLLPAEIHFLETLPNDALSIVGNQAEIEKIQRFLERASKGGKALAGRKGALEAPLEAVLEEELEAPLEAVLEAPLQACPRPRPRPSTKTKANKGTPSASSPDNDDGSGLFTPTDFLAAWNEHRGSLDAVARLTKGRAAKIVARRKEEPELSYWIDVIKRLAASDLATGKVKSEKYPHGWRADLAWLIKNDENHVKVSEGKYDNRAKKKPTSSMKVFSSEEDFR